MEKVEIKINDNQQKLVILEGNALEELRDLKINIEGDISSPYKFHSIRKGSPDKAIVSFSRTEMRITFMDNPEKPLSPTITGRLFLNTDLEGFKINSHCKMWGLQELAKFLKMNKTFFADKEKADLFISSLLSFKAIITSELEKSNDGRGNSKDLLDRKTNSNAPTDFILSMPVFVGGDKKTFRVEIGIDSTDSSAKFWLESSELQEIIISDRDSIINSEIKKFDGLIIIEQ